MILRVFLEKWWRVRYVLTILCFMYATRPFLNWNRSCMMLTWFISMECWGLSLSPSPICLCLFVSLSQIGGVLSFWCFKLCHNTCNVTLLLGMPNRLSCWRKHMPYFLIDCLNRWMLVHFRRYVHVPNGAALS